MHTGALMAAEVDSNLIVRSLRPEDYGPLRALHQELFPIDYEDSFFVRATKSLDNIFSYAAFCRQEEGGEELVGFVTVRTLRLVDCDPVDRSLMALSSRLLNSCLAAYILTIGVVEGYRQKRLASHLLQRVVRHASQAGCRTVYLHVISYNQPAISFYARNGFECIACLPNFYYIGTDRQAEPGKNHYDAYLFSHQIDSSPLYSPLLLIHAAISPVWNMIGQLGTCMTWTTAWPPPPQSSWPQPPAVPNVAEPTAHSMEGPGKASPWLMRLFSRHS